MGYQLPRLVLFSVMPNRCRICGIVSVNSILTVTAVVGLRSLSNGTTSTVSSGPESVTGTSVLPRYSDVISMPPYDSPSGYAASFSDGCTGAYSTSLRYALGYSRNCSSGSDTS